MKLEERAHQAGGAVRGQATQVDAWHVRRRIERGGHPRWARPAFAAGMVAVALVAALAFPLPSTPTVEIEPVNPGGQPGHDDPMTGGDSRGDDGMTETNQASDDEPGCSAAEASPVVVAQPGLPAPVAASRERVAAAAARCDYDALAEIARTSEQFSHAFDETGSPASHWRYLEERGDDEPLRYLRELLDLPYSTLASTTDRAEGTEIYVWPSAHDPGASDEAFDLLVEEGLYDEREVEGWRASGDYVGYRVGIDSDGHWMFFLTGEWIPGPG